jgi:hypothetical protein
MLHTHYAPEKMGETILKLIETQFLSSQQLLQID